MFSVLCDVCNTLNPNAELDAALSPGNAASTPLPPLSHCSCDPLFPVTACTRVSSTRVHFIFLWWVSSLIEYLLYGELLSGKRGQRRPREHFSDSLKEKEKVVQRQNNPARIRGVDTTQLAQLVPKSFNKV